MSGNPLSGSMTFQIATLATLGIDPSGSPYVWTLSNGETITLNVISNTPPPTSAAVQTSLLKKIKKLEKKVKKLRKRGQTAKVKKLKKKIKALKKRL